MLLATLKSKCIKNCIADILPYRTESVQATREFLQKVIDVLLDFVRATNDRNEKILDFHHPAEMQQLLDLRVPEDGLPLQQLINDCATTLKYQVKTGEFIYLLLLHESKNLLILNLWMIISGLMEYNHKRNCHSKL